jgi:hypothetical protein
MVKVVHTDLPHGVKLRCERAVCLDIRSDRLVWATWNEGSCCLGAPRFLRKLDNRYEIKPTTEFIYEEVPAPPQHVSLIHELLPVGWKWHEWKAFDHEASKRHRCTRNDHLKTMEDVLQFQIDHEGNLPRQSRTKGKETKLRKRYDRMKACGTCGALERMRLQWSAVYAGPAGKYLLGKATCKGKSFRSNAARNYRTVVKHQADMERKIGDMECKDEDLPTFGMADVYWASPIEEELGFPRPGDLRS